MLVGLWGRGGCWLVCGGERFNLWDFSFVEFSVLFDFGGFFPSTETWTPRPGGPMKKDKQWHRRRSV